MGVISNLFCDETYHTRRKFLQTSFQVGMDLYEKVHKQGRHENMHVDSVPTTEHWQKRKTRKTSPYLFYMQQMQGSLFGYLFRPCTAVG